jgi:hypothetical protein
MNATYDGKQLMINGEVIYHEDHERRALITHVDVNAGVKIIHSWAFSRCTALSSIVLPEGLSEIGYKAFYGCTALSSILLPEGLASIGKWAFLGCTALSSISIPESVPIGRVSPDAFSGCAMLSELSSAKEMGVEQFLRWRRRAPRQRYAVLASLLRLRTELYARPTKRAAVAEERKEDEDGDGEGGGGEGEEAQHGAAQGLEGKVAFDMITSSDVWRCILEFL